ncbi:hypothetical protein CYLTODRAFT_272826 [Cylindrobasidium torrendii FP15055 ss-10]|uniref:Uncharacterized protein n=1 Tax=Cylindrobasidium torrendii FP15055 ss-10 TaxID=1314674 RepID=A0A0D7BC30_9AGAR|nr:hypothetical protein CYLTODRAFT_272826 [Cylindrobasidium torrendii FP15055 ss-10]
MVLGLGTGFPACSQSDSSAHNNALSSDIVENTPADVLNTLSMVGTAPNRQVFSSSDQHVGDDNTPTDSPRSNFVVSERASQTNTSGETPKPILAGDIPSQPTMQRLASPNCPPLPDSKDALSSLPSESAIECGRSNLFKLESSIANEPQRFHDDDVLKTFTPSPSSTAISHFAQILDDLAKTEPMQQHELSMDTHTSHRGSQQDKVEAIPTQSVTSCTSISRHDPFLNTSISPSQEGDASALRGVDCSEHEITLDVKRELAEQILQFDVDNESQPLPSTGVQEASAFVPGSSSDTHAARTEPSLQDVQDQGGHVFVPDVQEAGQPHLEILPTQSPDVKPEPLDVLIPGQTIGSNAMSKGRAALSRMKARGGAKSKFIPERVPKSLGLKRRPLPVPKTEPPDVVEIPPSPVKQEAAPQVSLPSSALVAEVTVVEDLTLDVPVEPSAKFVTREDMNTHVEKAAGDAGMSEMGTDLVETQAPECDQRHTPTSLLNDQVVDTTSRKAQSTAASMLFSHDTIPEDVPLDPSLGQTYPDVRRAKEEEIPPELSMSVTEVSRLKRESPPCRTFNIGEDKLKTEEDMMGSTPLGLLHQWEVISAPLKRPATIDLFSSTKKTKRRKSELDVPMHRPGWFVRPYAKQSACQPTVNSARNPRHWFSSWADMRTSGFCRIGEGITDSLLGHPIVVVGNEHGIKLEKDQELGQSNVGWKLYVRRGYRRPMDSWELAPSLQIVQPGNFYPYPPNAFPPGSVTSHSLAYMLPSQSPMRQPFEPAKPFGVSAQDLSTLLPLPEVKDENSGPYSIPTLPKQEQAYEAPCKRAHRPPELASLFEASDVGLPILVVSDPRDAGLGVGKEIGPVVLGWFEIVSIEDKVEELDTHEWCFHLKWKADENEERPWWDGVDAQEGQGADVESDVLPPSFYGDRRAEKLAWHCARCGKVNMQTTFRHLKCSSSFCGKHTPDALSPLVLSDVVRNPQDKLPTAKPHPYSPGAAETCWDDGMKTFEYAREGTKMSIHHIFTGNIPTLQEDADVVWRDLQREVVLEFHEYDYRNYFTLEMEILPKSVKDAVAWVEDVIETYGEAAVQDSFVTLKVLAWWKESKRRVSRRLAAQGRPVVLACLGSALTLTLSGVTNKAQLRGSIQSSNEQNGIQTPPDYVVGMVHGDVLFLSGDDFEVSSMFDVLDCAWLVVLTNAGSTT